MCTLCERPRRPRGPLACRFTIAPRYVQWQDALEQGQLKQPPGAPPTTSSARACPSIRSIMQFDGPAPELINGRAAMLGFAAALLGELATGESVLNLLNDVPQGVIVVFTLILVGSLFPMGMNIHPHHKAHGFFTAQNEIWGGRLACDPTPAQLNSSVHVDGVASPLLFGSARLCGRVTTMRA